MSVLIGLKSIKASRRKIEEFSFRKESEKRSKWFTPIFSSKGLTKIRGMLKIFLIFQIS